MYSQNCTVALSPMRASFVGGGSDLPEYYQRYGGAAVGAGIKIYNLVQLITHHQTLTPWRLCSTRGIRPDTRVGGIGILDAVLREYQLQNCCSAFSYCDLAELGSGLGSSSSLTVATVAAAARRLNKAVPKSELAEQAFHIERHGMGSPVGKQDHYMAAWGGLQVYEFHQEGTVSVHPVNLSAEKQLEFESWLSLIPIPRATSANEILTDHSKRLRNSDQALNAQHAIKKLVEPFMTALENHHFSGAAVVLDKAWKIKQTLSSSITHGAIDSLYERARAAGALGGKLLGAGGGGHMLLMIPPERKAAVRNALHEFSMMDLIFDHDGAKIIHAN